MNYFEEIINALDASISIETDKMLEASKKLQETTQKIEELKRQKETVLALTNRVTTEY
jgi:DNA repair exonuclease SbcCD ATPase subunit